MQNKFITIEGVEGVGKSTAMKTIQAYLMARRADVVLTREPGGTPMAEAIRQILLASHAETVSPDTELLLMFASRAQHMENVIKPALAAGKCVVSDRFVDASFAYQGGGRQMDMRKIQMLDQWIVGQIVPDLTFLLDAPVDVGLMRVKNRGPHDRIEQEKRDFFERVRAVYLERARAFPSRFCVIDATEPFEKVEEALRQRLDVLFGKAGNMHHAG